jgi:regulatory protein
LANKLARPRAKVSTEPLSPLQIRERALRLLSSREHTAKELIRKLLRPTKSGTSQRADVEQVVAELTSRGLQSDERTVSAFVTSRQSRFGARRIENELRQKGANAEAVREALTAHDEVTPCKRVYEKRFKAPPTSRKEYMRHAQFLATRGFSMATIRTVMQSAKTNYVGIELEGTDIEDVESEES